MWFLTSLTLPRSLPASLYPLARLFHQSFKIHVSNIFPRKPFLTLQSVVGALTTFLCHFQSSLLIEFSYTCLPPPQSMSSSRVRSMPYSSLSPCSAVSQHKDRTQNIVLNETLRIWWLNTSALLCELSLHPPLLISVPSK